ncbi:MAG: nitrous oxide-stimulated promoter family protein [Planctomycetes bacterium]|nr:nitrous oxide-stimulated promoter family protein [Planctomycetota bacterium]
MKETKPRSFETAKAAFADDQVRRELRTLGTFIEVYCKAHHRDQPKSTVPFRHIDIRGLAGHEVRLCEACGKLLQYSFMMRSLCPLDPKPSCKHCPQPCYSDEYRRQIREVMRYSGLRLLLTGRIDYLYRYFF